MSAGHTSGPLRVTEEDFARAAAEVERLQRDLDITNADHIALWLEANLPDASLGFIACRIVEAHEAKSAAPELLEALVAFVAGADAGHVTVEVDQAARAAIAKATGAA